MAEKTFNQAFSEARKQGLAKFQWRGGWYSTELAEERSVASHTSVKKGDSKQKHGRSNGTVTNRFVIRNHGKEGYSVYDNEVGRYIGNLHKDKQAAINYLNSDKFKEDSGELNITAARTKLDRNTSGFLPVDSNKNYLDRQGNTRLYQEIGTGRYLVTDNYGNIVVYSFDPAAATSDSNWGGWISYTGSKNDLKAAGAGRLRDEANRNEVNQKAEQADLRSRGLGVTNSYYDNGDMADAINEGKTATANVINQTLNLPFHTIWGALKLGIDNTIDSWTNTNRDLYKANAKARQALYLKGFDLNHAYMPLGLTAGPGDIVATYMPEGQFKDFTLMAGNIAGNAALGSWLGRSTQSTARKDLAGYEIRHLGNAGTVPRKGIAGLVRGNGQYRGRVTQLVGENLWTTKKTDPMLKVTYTGGNKSRPQAMYRTSGGRYIFYPKTDVSIKPLYNRYNEVATYGGSIIPWQSATMGLLEGTVYGVNTSTPTAGFYYSSEGNPNTYAQGRVATGEVVPGTSGENWNGGTSGSRVTVRNTEGLGAPAFGGVTIGTNARDNESAWYLPLGYHKNGSKLIPRKK